MGFTDAELFMHIIQRIGEEKLRGDVEWKNNGRNAV
jgi:hypothetical protein